MSLHAKFLNNEGGNSWCKTPIDVIYFMFRTHLGKYTKYVTYLSNSISFEFDNKLLSGYRELFFVGPVCVIYFGHDSIHMKSEFGTLYVQNVRDDLHHNGLTISLQWSVLGKKSSVDCTIDLNHGDVFMKICDYVNNWHNAVINNIKFLHNHYAYCFDQYDLHVSKMKMEKLAASKPINYIST